jgi:thiamine pyrophosphate-dependent acetolactate synthase large subunit-like protein
VLAGAGPALRRLGELTARCSRPRRWPTGCSPATRTTLGIAGGFASPLAARAARESDAIVAFGAALNQWTTQHGALIGPGARVVQVDLEPTRSAPPPADVGVIGDAREPPRRSSRCSSARADGPAGDAGARTGDPTGAAGRRALRGERRRLSIRAR